MIDYRVIIFLLPFCVGNDLGEKKYLFAENSDDTIQRPCGAVYDIDCVREYFYEHSKCKKTYGPAPDPYIRTHIILDFPGLNLTVSGSNVPIGGLNGRIDEFYINKETDRAVFSILFRNLSMSSDRALFRFHRRAKEPIVEQSPAFVLYPSVLFTVVIPNINDFQLEKAEYKAYVNDFSPIYGLGPNLLIDATDPQVVLTISEFLLRPELNVQEILSTDPAFYPASYIQYNICDFGLKLP